MSKEVAIAGIGETAYTRQSAEGTASLAGLAVSRALEDAGLEATEIDALVTAHGNEPGDVAGVIALTQLARTDVVKRGGASPLVAVHEASEWLRKGEVKYVLVFRARNGASEMPSKSEKFRDHVLAAFPRPDFRLDYEFPYGAVAPVHFFALLCQRHMALYGTTREHLGAVAVQHRASAQLNPRAQTFGRPLALEDYLEGRPISEPLRRYDCCLQTDGGAAVILTTLERARMLRKRPIRVLGTGVGVVTRPADYVNRPDLLELGTAAAARGATASADVRASELDAWMVYDAFTSLVLQQLEELGICARGEAGDFVAEGTTAHGGALPVNPHGGLLAEGHMLGVSHLNEAVRQLRGESGKCQVAEAEVIGVTGFGNLGEAAVGVLAR